MLIPFLISKIHRATVTASDLHYYGSISIDERIMKEANLRENQKVEVYNINNGNRFSTYVITGKKDSGEMVVNGAAAHLVNPGDLIIVAAYALVDEREINTLNSVILIMKDKNQIERVIHGKV